MGLRRRPGDCFFEGVRHVLAWCSQLPAQGVDALIARCVVSREAFVAPAGRVLLYRWPSGADMVLPTAGTWG